MRIINSEGAIQLLLKETMSTVDKIKTLQSAINALKTSVDEESEVRDEDDDWMNDPRYAEAKEATRKDYENELEQLKIRGSHPDGLEPIVVLMGDASMIMQNVIEPFKKEVLYDSYYGWDIEFKEIDSSQLTKDYVRNLQRPTAEDGGVLFVKNLSCFCDMYDINDQAQIVRDIMVNRFGVISTGWRIVFIEDTDDKEKTFPNAFIYNWTKGNLYIWFVE